MRLKDGTSSRRRHAQKLLGVTGMPGQSSRSSRVGKTWLVPARIVALVPGRCNEFPHDFQGRLVPTTSRYAVRFPQRVRRAGYGRNHPKSLILCLYTIDQTVESL